LVIAGTVIIGALAAGAMNLGNVGATVFSDTTTREAIAETIAPYIITAVVAIYAVVFLAAIFYVSGVRNIAFNATTLEGGHSFVSSISRLRYAWILISNFVATIVSLSLLRPWAAVRTWRYLAASTAVVSTGTLDGFIDEAMPQGNVAAAEYFDIEGIDFGL